MSTYFSRIRPAFFLLALLANYGVTAQNSGSPAATPPSGGNIMAPYEVPGIYETTQDYKYDRRNRDRSRVGALDNRLANKPGDPFADAVDEALNIRADKEPDLEKRLALNNEAVSNKPTANNYFRLANTLYQMLKYTEAIAAYKKAGKLMPGDERVLVQLANAFAMAGKPAEAEAVYEKVLKANLEADIDLQLIWVRQQRGNAAGALGVARRYSAKIPTDVEPYLLQAGLSKGNPQSGALLDKAASLNKSIKRNTASRMLFSYAQWLQSVGDVEASIVFLDVAVGSSPKDIEILELRAATNKKLGRLEQAKADEQLLKAYKQ